MRFDLRLVHFPAKHRDKCSGRGELLHPVLPAVRDVNVPVRGAFRVIVDRRTSGELEPADDMPGGYELDGRCGGLRGTGEYQRDCRVTVVTTKVAAKIARVSVL